MEIIEIITNTSLGVPLRLQYLSEQVLTIFPPVCCTGEATPGSTGIRFGALAIRKTWMSGAGLERGNQFGKWSAEQML